MKNLHKLPRKELRELIAGWYRNPDTTEAKQQLQHIRFQMTVQADFDDEKLEMDYYFGDHDDEHLEPLHDVIPDQWFEESTIPHFRLEYSLTTHVGDIIEESYTQRIHVNIIHDSHGGFYGRDSINDEEQGIIGHIELEMINWKRAGKGCYYSVPGLQKMSDPLEEFIDNETGLPKPQYAEEFKIADSQNILYIRHMMLKPPFRHHHYGALILKALLDTFYGTFAVAVVHSYPMQFYIMSEEEHKADKDEVNYLGNSFIASSLRIAHYYQRMGFTIIRKEYDSKHPLFFPPYLYLNPHRPNPLWDPIDPYIVWDY